MKKTTLIKTENQTTKLAIRTERVRDLQNKQLENVRGGVMEYKSHQSSCC